jgi:hypothetical protein
MLDQQDYRELVRLVAYEQAKLSTSAWFFTGEDHLRVRSFGALAGVVLAVEGRFLTADGQLISVGERHVPNSDRTEATSLHTLGEGFLLNLSVRASTGSPRVGQVFVTVEVVRGRLGAVQILGALTAGYVTDTQRLAWPGTPAARSIDGPGVIRSITGTDPAAGAEISETVPTNARWRLLALRANLTTDATVATRVVSLRLAPAATLTASIQAPNSQAASATYAYNYALESADRALVVTADIPVRLPQNALPGGSTISTVTAGIVAGDNWGAPGYTVEEWIED